MMTSATRAIVLASLVALGLTTTAWAAPTNPIAPALAFDATTGYYKPPTWNSMVMVNITFSGTNIGWLPSTYDFTVGPVLRSAPANGANETFDPNQPWAVLNGTAFNRQLGWYDGVQDDFYATHGASLGANSLWIEKVGGSPELKTYFIAEESMHLGPYTPIFGTDGSSTKWKWDGFMDHNAYAVDLADLTEPDQLFTHEYNLYVGDANGNRAPGYGDLNLTWSFIGPADVPEPATLTILLGGTMILAIKRKKLVG